jgi:tRNA 5-methylaminomethyl-2-thiouridine biosynthesis bifunctional protein
VSGNPAGLFHGTVGSADTPYTRWHRAASFSAARWWRQGGSAGAADGLLRLAERVDHDAMQALLQAQRLPADYVQALDAAQASARAGLALEHPAWCFTHGGWADPAALVRVTLGAPGVQWRGDSDVSAVVRAADGWRVLDGAGRVLGDAPLVVLANAEQALPLAALPPTWVARTRGQLSWLAGPAIAPALPVSSGAYALTLPDGRLLFGATQHSDDDPTLRRADHAENLERVTRLLGRAPGPDPLALQGRVAWRVGTRDRLPLVGAVPDLVAARPARCDAPRLLPRRPGLYMHSALGGRGLTTSALGGEVIAAMATGAPWPLEADLVDAIDPARWALK